MPCAPVSRTTVSTRDASLKSCSAQHNRAATLTGEEIKCTNKSEAGRNTAKADCSKLPLALKNMDTKRKKQAIRLASIPLLSGLTITKNVNHDEAMKCFKEQLCNGRYEDLLTEQCN